MCAVLPSCLSPLPSLPLIYSWQDRVSNKTLLHQISFYHFHYIDKISSSFPDELWKIFCFSLKVSFSKEKWFLGFKTWSCVEGKRKDSGVLVRLWSCASWLDFGGEVGGFRLFEGLSKNWRWKFQDFAAIGICFPCFFFLEESFKSD